MLHREAGHVHEVVVVVAVVHVALHPLRLQPVPPAALEAELGLAEAVRVEDLE